MVISESQAQPPARPLEPFFFPQIGIRQALAEKADAAAQHQQISSRRLNAFARLGKSGRIRLILIIRKSRNGFQNRIHHPFSFQNGLIQRQRKANARARRDTFPAKVNGMGLSVDRAVRFQGQHHIAVVNRQAVRNLNSAHDAVDRVIPFLWIQIQRMKIICLTVVP